MMPRYGVDTVGTHYEYGRNSDFILKNEVVSIQHNALLILKHPGLTGYKFSIINQSRKHNHSEGDYKIYG